MSSNPTNSIPVTTLQYRDISNRTSRNADLPISGSRPDSHSGWRQGGIEITEAELAERITRERVSAANETEQRLRKEYEQKLLAARAPIAEAIKGFKDQRDQYFAELETEVVKLTLSIAAKILHRESQVDPMLVASLVRYAMQNMREGSNVTVRVCPGKGETWRQYFESANDGIHVEIVEDPQLNDQDCVMETELGSADFGLDKQLKEVERGFYDLLALRPASK